jgi:fibronectin-binding autotransporter adhesin
MTRFPARKRRAFSAHPAPAARRVRPLATSLARFTSVAAVCGALLAGAGSARAATYYWDADGAVALNALDGTGLGGAGNWDNVLLNWWNGLSADVAWPNTTADTAIFAGTPGLVTLTAPISANALRFDAGFSLNATGANALTLGGVLPSISVTNSGQLVTVDAPIALSSSAVFGGAGNLKLNGIVSGALFGFTKVGAGTVTLSGANTFTGPVILNTGTLVATTSNTALGTGSTLSLRGGELKLANDTALTMANATTVAGNAQITTDTAGGTTGVTHSLGTLSIGGQTLTVSGGSTVMTGTQGLTFLGTSLTGNATIAVNNSTAAGSTSTTLLTLGVITNNGFTSTFTGNGSVAQSAAAVAGVGGITYSGTGTLTLNQTNLFTGPVTVTSGTVVGTSVAGALGAGNLILQGGNLLLTNTSGTGLAFARPTFVTGPATITSDVNAPGGAGNTHTFGTLEIGAQTLTIKPGANVTAAGNTGITFGVSTFTGNSTFDVQTPSGAPGTTTLTLANLNDAGTARAITFQNTLSGPTQSKVALNTLATSLVDGSSVTLAGTGSGVNLTLGTVATGLGGITRLTVNGNSSLTLGFASVAYQLASLSGTGTVTATAASTLTVGNSSSTAPDTTFSGQILAGTGLTLVKSGKNTLTLSGTASNSTTGVTLVNTGTLVLSKADPVGGTNPVALSGTGLTIGSAAATTTGKATVRLGAGNQITAGGTMIMNGGSTLALNGFGQQFGTFATMFGSTISGGAGSLLTLGGGTVTLTATGINTISADTLWGGGTRTFGVTNAPDTLTISGKIGNDATAIAKTGNGTLILSGDNSYTGATTFASTFGIINIQHANALGAISSGTTVASGGTLQIQGSITTAAEPLTLGGAGFVGNSGVNVQNGALVNVSGTNNFAGPISLSVAATVSSDAGTLNLTNATPVAGAFALTLTGAGDGSISGGLGIGAGTLTKNGAGTWIIAGASTSTGTMTVTGGTLQVGDGATGSWTQATGPGLTLSGAGRFNYKGVSTGSTLALGQLSFSLGDGVVQSTYGGTSGNTVLSFNASSRTAGATGNFVVSGGTNGDTNKITLPGATLNAFLNHGLFFGGDAYAWYDAGGYVRGLNYNTPDTGAVTTAGGTSLPNATHQQITAAVTAQDNVTFTTLNIAGNHNITLNANQSITVNGLLKTGNTAGGSTISGGAGIKAASGAELVIRTNGANDLLTINTPVLANGSSSLTKSGAGTVLLGMANTYTGATTVDGGTLMLGSGGTLLSAITVRTGGVLDLNGQTITNGVSISGPGAGVAAIGALTNGNTTTAAQLGAITLATAANIGGAGNIISTGALAGTTFPMVKVGAGTVTFGDNAGTVMPSVRTAYNQIDAGVLKISNSATAIGTAAAQLILNGGTLHIASAAVVGAYPVAVTKDSGVITDVFSGTAGLAHVLGTLAIGGNKLTVSAGANLTSGASLAFGATSLQGNPTFDVQNPAGTTTNLTLGALNDLGTARTITFQNSGTAASQSKVTLGTAAASLMDGTTISIPAGTNGSGGVNLTLATVATGLGTMSRVTVEGNSVLTLAFAATTYQLGSLAGSGSLNPTAAATLTIGNSNSTALDSEFSGQILPGAGLTLTKAGTNTLTLSGTASNTTTGVTLVNTGTLVLSKTGGTNVFALTGTGLTIGAAATATAGNATVRYGASNQLLDTTTLIMNAGATLDLAGFNQKFGTFGTMAGATISGANSLLTLSGTGTLTVTGTNLISANLLLGGGTRTIATTGVSDSLTISGNIGNDSSAFTKAGTGTVILSGTNTYTGITTISAGTLKLGSAGALYSGGTGALTLTAGTLDLGGYAFNNITTFTGTAGLVTSSAAGGSLTATALGTTNAASFSGNLTLDLSVASGAAATTLTGSFTNTGNITLTSASANLLTVGAAAASLSNGGNVVFNANGAGAITVSSGNLNPAGTIMNSGSSASPSGTTTLSGIIGTNVTGVVQNSVNSQLTLAGANVFASGLKIINGQVNGTNATAAFGAGTVTLGDAATASTGATLNLGVTAATYINPITTVANTNGGVLTVQDGGAFIATLSGPITQNSPLTIKNTSTALFTVNGGISSTSGAGNDLTISANGTGAITLAVLPVNHTGSITNNGSSTGTVTISGNIGSNVTGVAQTSAGSQLTLSGANTFAGGVAVKRGTVNATTNATALSSGTVTLGDVSFGTGATLLGAGLNFANPIVLASGATGTLMIGNFATGAIFSGGVTGNNALTIQNTGTTSTLTFQGGDIAVAGPITVTGTATTGTTTISSNITSANTAGVTLNSTHNLVLSGNNTYSGLTTLALAGTLQGTTSTFSDTPVSPFGTSSLVLNAGILQLRSPGVTGSALVGTTTAETVTFAHNVTVGGNATVNVDRTAGISTSANKTIALGTLTIAGQTLGVTGANTYRLSFGATTASGFAVFNPTTAPLTLGSLTLSDSIVSNTSTVITLGGTALTNVVNGLVSDNASDATKRLALIKSGTGLWMLNGANTYTGGSNLTGGTLGGSALAFSATPGSPFGTGDLVVSTAATLQLRTPGVTGTGTVGTTTAETVIFGNNLTVAAATTIDTNITTGFTGSTNKTIALGTLAIGGQTLTVTGGNAYGVSFGATTSSGPSIFAANAALSLASLTLADSVATGTTTTITLSGTPVTGTSPTSTVSGVISNNATDSTKVVGITKSGTGTWALLGANTFTGPFNVTAGRLQFATTGGVPGTTPNSFGLGTDPIGLSAGATLEFVGSTDQTLVRAVTFPATGLAPGIFGSGTNGAVLTYPYALTPTTPIILGGTGATLFQGAVTVTGGTGLLTKNGTGTVTFEEPVRAATFGINGGKVVLTKNAIISPGTASVQVNGGATLDIGGTTGTMPNAWTIGTSASSGFVIDSVGGGSIMSVGLFAITSGEISASLASPASPAPSGSLYKDNFGTITISGNNPTFRGGLTMEEDTVIFDYTTRNGEKIGDGGGINMALYQASAAPSLVSFHGNASAPTYENIGNIVIGGPGMGTIELVPGGTQTLTLDLEYIVRRSVLFDGTLNFVSSGNAIFKTLATNRAGSIFAGWVTMNGRRFATVQNGILQEAVTAVKDDVTTWQAGENLSDLAGYTGTRGSLSINSLVFTASAGPSTVTLAPGAVLNISAGSILNAATAQGVIQGGAITVGASHELFLSQLNTTADLVINSDIGGMIGLSKGGRGTAVLGGHNTFTGRTIINEGTLRLTGNQSLGRNTVVSVHSVGNTGAKLDVASGAHTIGGLSAPTALGLVNIESNASLTLNMLVDQTYGSPLTGGGTLIKSGPATLIMGGTSPNFTGLLQVNAGDVLVQSTGGGGALLGPGATFPSFVVNGPTAGLTSVQAVAAAVNRLGDSSSITLNNTNGGSGLRVLDTFASTTASAETVGVVTLGAGHNTISAQGGTDGGTYLPRLTATSLARQNKATLLVRGENLGTTATSHGTVTFDTALASTLVGGGGLAGSTTIGILPYVVTNSDSSGTGVGTSFATYDVTNGVRGLTNAEYATDAAGYNALAGATDNVRFATNPGQVGAGSKTINSLVLDGSAESIAMIGAAPDVLTIASGAILHTSTASATQASIGGFASLATSGGRDYTIFTTAATNPLTISSQLSSPVALVKSGAGTLVLTNATNSYTGGTWFNQGLIEVSDLSNLGAGALNFFGGGIRMAAGNFFDLSSRAHSFGTGGGIIDTNGSNVTFFGAIGGNGPGGFTKAGNGFLTLNAPVNYSGVTTVTGGTLRYGVAAALPATMEVELRGGGTLDTAAFGGTLRAIRANGDASVSGTSNLTVTEEFVKSGTGTLTLNAPVSPTGYTGIIGGTLRYGVAGALAPSTSLELGNATLDIGSFVTTLGGLQLSGDGVINGSANLNFTGDVVVIGGAARTLTVNNTGVTTFGGANFKLVDTGVNSTIINNQTVYLPFTFAGSGDVVVSGGIADDVAAGGVTMSGMGELVLSGNNTYINPTTVNSGTVVVDGSLAGPVTVTGGTLQVNGSIAGAVTITGGTINGLAVLTVGDSIGTADTVFAAGTSSIGSITTTGALSLSSDVLFRFELNSSTGLADQVTAKGITLAPGSTFEGLDLAVVSVELPFGTNFTVFNNTAASDVKINGTFSNLADGTLVAIGANYFAVNYNGGDGNDLTFTTAVPEPGTGLTLAAGIGALLGLQRLQRRRRA